MAINRISESRLRLIQKRQLRDAWGKAYQAAIWATPTEAPGISTPTILHPAKLGGRPMHTLSRPETWAALLALYHPCVWDVHEQRMLYPGPRPHFLDSHPGTVGKAFKPLRGTLAVAEEMGRLSKHPKCRVQQGESNVWAPFPYIGDLLLFINGAAGPHAVNWSVKDKRDDFRRRGPMPGKPQTEGSELSALQRHALEATYYQDAGIRTHQVAGREIDATLRSNLHRLFLSHAEPVQLSPAVCLKLCEHFDQMVGSSTPAYKIVREAALHLGVETLVMKNVLEQGIWHRRIQVDLFEPVLLDRPLVPMREDPLGVYCDWFADGEAQ
ncbi:hypothetical protein [Comamonas guangdongensis]|uniref:Transposase n=1 Tax=Comamonas guangdongensis TaxID=510515 RepID=A0ABV3ZZ49_9BURK